MGEENQVEAQHSSGGGGARPAGGGFVNPDSVLAVTAAEIIAAHGPAGEPDGAFEPCRRCGEPSPCGPVRGATQVLLAAGLPMPGTGAVGDSRGPVGGWQPPRDGHRSVRQAAAPVPAPALPYPADPPTLPNMPAVPPHGTMSTGGQPHPSRATAGNQPAARFDKAAPLPSAASSR